MSKTDSTNFKKPAVIWQDIGDMNDKKTNNTKSDATDTNDTSGGGIECLNIYTGR